MGTLREDHPELFEGDANPRAIFDAYAAKYDCPITYEELLDVIANSVQTGDRG